MENLWIKIATRYKDRTCVAAYDVMNEPLNNADTEHGVLPENAAGPVAGRDAQKSGIRQNDKSHTLRRP